MHPEIKRSTFEVETILKFDETTRCALRRGFEMNTTVVEELRKIMDGEQIELVIELLKNFDDNDDFGAMNDFKTIYVQIAKAELKRIENGVQDKDMACGHFVDEHKKVLEEVIKTVEPAIN